MLNTARLILKDHSLHNLTKLHQWYNDESLAYYDSDEPFVPQSMDVIKDYLKKRLLKCRLADGRDIIHLAIHRKAGSLIGYCMIAQIDRFNKRCKIGLTIGAKSEWGKGFAKEVVEVLLEYCFDVLAMNRVGVEIFATNERSISLFEGLGFKKEGNMRQNVLKAGTYIDEYIYALLKSEWRQACYKG